MVALGLLGATALAAPAQAAAAAPAPKLSKLSNPPKVKARTQAFVVRDTVVNKGRRKTARTKVDYFLSRTKRARRAKGDIGLSGSRKVGPLRPGKRSSGKRKVKVPAKAKPGRYFLLACVKRSCRQAKRKLRVATYPKPQKAPATVKSTVDARRAQTKVINGIDYHIAIGPDGTRYSLAMPRHGANGVTVTMTPVTALEGVPSKGLIGAVQLEPHGLLLRSPAKLTITPPAEAPVAEQAGIVFHQGGRDLHLHPLAPTREITLELNHFSTVGVVRADGADRARISSRIPARASAQLEQDLAQAAAARRQAIVGGNAGAGAPKSAVQTLAKYFDDVVVTQLEAAIANDSLAQAAIAEALGWERTAELLGLGSDPAISKRAKQMLKLIERVIRGAIDKAFKRCVNDHDLEQIANLLGLERTAQLLGIEAAGALDRAQRCASFEIELESQLTTASSWTQGPAVGGGVGDSDIVASQHDGRFRVRASKLALDWTGRGEGPINWVSSAYSASTTHNSCSPSGTWTEHLEGVGTLDGRIAAQLVLDLNPREKQPPGHPAPSPPVNWIKLEFPGTHLSGAPRERLERTVSGCRTEAATQRESTRWATIFDSFHNVNDGSGVPKGFMSFRGLPIPSSSPKGNLLFSRTFDQSRGQQSQWMGAQSDRTTLDLVHRPKK